MSEQAEVVFHRLFTTMNIEKQMDNIVGMMVSSSDLDDEGKEIVKKMIDNITPEYMTAVKDEYARLMGQKFTREEADEIEKWYSSDVGKKMTAIAPTVAAEFYIFVSKKMLPTIETKMREFLEKELGLDEEE